MYTAEQIDLSTLCLNMLICHVRLSKFCKKFTITYLYTTYVIYLCLLFHV